MKSLPADIQAERSVLGAILLEPQAIIILSSWFLRDYFYLERHAWIYEAMTDCYERRVPPDIAMVADALRRRERLEDIGGIAYLGELSAEVPTAVYVEHYGHVVRDAAIRRKLIETSGHIQAIGYEEKDTVQESLAKAEQMLFDITQGNIAQHYADAALTMQDCFSFIQRAQDGEGGIRTGFDYDQQQGGFFRGDLIILAARPSVGKTMLALHIAKNIAQRGGNVGFVSLEMSTVQLGLRLIAMTSGIPVQTMRRGELSQDELDRVVAAMGTIADLPIFIDDQNDQTLADIRSRARHLQHRIGTLDLLIIDYISMIRSQSEKGNRVQELERIANGLKGLAKELNCPVLVLSQLSRAVEGRSSHVPQLSDLRDSGGIEQAADSVVFLYREDMYEKDTEKKGLVELHIAKSRQGQLGTVQLFFDTARSSFHNITKQRTPEGY